MQIIQLADICSNVQMFELDTQHTECPNYFLMFKMIINV